jgi:LysR family positive regulator for ilvC
MDIKALKQFQHLASSLSFSKTANAMFVSPPTLTRSIIRLEEELGASLFLRDNRNVQLTNAGRKMLAFADETLTKYHNLKSEIGLQKNELRGELSLYSSVTAAQTYLPTILASMRELYPSVDIKLETGDHELATRRISDLKHENVADLALAIHTPDFPANIYFQPIDTVPLALIVPNSMDANTIGDISWHTSNVIMPAKGPSRRIVHHWFAEHNIRPRIYAKVSGNEAIVSMVSLGLGIGFVPRIVLENSTAKSKVKSIPVSNIEPYQLGLCYLKERANEPLIKTISQLFSR